MIAGAWMPPDVELDIRPAGSVEYTNPRSPIWTTGYPTGVVRVFAAGTRRLWIAGVCGASDERLRELLVAPAPWWPTTRTFAGSFLAVQRRGASLTIRGDTAGLRTVYWARRGPAVLWADAASPLAAAIDAGPDLVRAVCAPTVSGIDALGPHSLFHEIHRVPPGAVLEIDDDGVRVHPAPEPDAPEARDDRRERVAAALTRAVTTRVLGARNPSTDLSGGKDSGVVAALAGAAAPTRAYTWRDRFSVNSDLDHALRIAAAVPGLRHEVVTGTEHTANYRDSTTRPHTPPHPAHGRPRASPADARPPARSTNSPHDPGCEPSRGSM
ncbi:asparagine synthase-related protein [Embleya sp. NPDC055664]